MALKTGSDTMRWLSALLVVAGMATTPVYATDSEELFVGRTNIFCVKAPCPWRGIFEANDILAGPSGLLWSEQALPPLDASPENARKIAEAWNNHQCLKILGRMTDERLMVEKILGPCP